MTARAAVPGVETHADHWISADPGNGIIADSAGAGGDIIADGAPTGHIAHTRRHRTGRQKILATAIERQYLERRIAEANVTEGLAKELFTMFCEGHGMPGAIFVGIEGDSIIVELPTA